MEIRMTKTPGPARGLLTAGIALADTKPMQAPTDPAGESISRRACGAGSRSTLIVPRRAGNRGHRDPLEGRGVSPGPEPRMRHLGKLWVP